MGKRDLVALLCFPSWCRLAVVVLWLFLTVINVDLACYEGFHAKFGKCDINLASSNKS